MAVDAQAQSLHRGAPLTTWYGRWLRNGVITTAAGTGAAGSSGDGGLATQAQLNTPVSVAADQSGNIYIADAGANKIRRIAPDGTITTFAGTGTRRDSSGDGGLRRRGAAVLTQRGGGGPTWIGCLIADTGNNRDAQGNCGRSHRYGWPAAGRRVWSGDGGAAYLAALKCSGLRGDRFLDGTAYIADEGNQRIRRICPVTRSISSST